LSQAISDDDAALSDTRRDEFLLTPISEREIGEQNRICQAAAGARKN
jgi:hypothetical protein